ncbi:hypothetical protein JCM19235_1458 [Vibrio maritimus]|uniref:Uncharacterized protein n=1 Tax=Vibrio maritimus TaxID=990268 RepID=A0A090S258_9VIBR|nr:hypothetical protein JCM19235_1458 [Vibrio maritimus]
MFEHTKHESISYLTLLLMLNSVVNIVLTRDFGHKIRNAG